jgi:hypothetical protein
MKAHKSTYKRNILLGGALSFLLLDFLLVIAFRNIRDLLPPPEIGKKHIIGYSQYFGYPFYLDTIIFFILICYPLGFFIVIKLWNQHSKRKKNEK